MHFSLPPTGIAALDAQHRAFEARLAGASSAAAWASLGAFVAKHFAHEERLMDAHGGGPLELEHRREHAELLAELAAREPGDLAAAAARLRGWTLRHVAAMDVPLGAWLVARGVR